MRFGDVAELVKVTQTPNAIGEITETKTDRQVYVSVRSVGERETYEAGALGLKPEIAFILANKADYEGEQIVRFDETDYRVIRTFSRDSGERLEIVCEKMLNKGRD